MYAFAGRNQSSLELHRHACEHAYEHVPGGDSSMLPGPEKPEMDGHPEPCKHQDPASKATYAHWKSMV